MVLNRHMRRVAKAVGLPTPDSKPQRTQDEVRQAYGQACAKAGELQYKIGEFQAELDKINDEIRSLNLEFSSLPAPQAPAKEETK